MKMAEAGMSLTKMDHVSDNSFFSSNSSRTSEKRGRSPSLSSDEISDNEDEVDYTPPYLDITDYDQDIEVNAKDEYKSVMNNLRRSAANCKVSPVKSQVCKDIKGPPLINENEIVSEWLIKDTNEVPKVKKKKRRLSKLNVRTSKCIDNFLISQDKNYESDSGSISPIPENRMPFDKTKIRNDNSETVLLESENSKLSFCLRVRITDKLILVPIPDDTCTIKWLSEEAAHRYQSINLSKPHLTLMKNGALLLGSDLVKNIFSNNEEVSTSVEFWEDKTLDDKYVQLCAKRSTKVYTSIKNILQSSKNFELNFSNCSIPSLQLSILFSALMNYKSLQLLNISGIVLNDKLINELIDCFQSFTMLKSLNMSCCNLTSKSMKVFSEFLSSQKLKNILPELKALDLSFNSFSACPVTWFYPIFNLESLLSINLASCDLNSSFFLDQTLSNIIKNKILLEELKISGNKLNNSELSNFLNHLPQVNLQKLNLKHTINKEMYLGSKLSSFFSVTFLFLYEIVLQGCYLTDSDIDQIAMCLHNCPKVQVLDLSVNPSVSSSSMCFLLNKVHEKLMHIMDINITGTCAWQDKHLCSLKEVIYIKSVKQFYLDNVSKYLTEHLEECWRNKWEDRALCLSNFFLQLRIS